MREYFEEAKKCYYNKYIANLKFLIFTSSTTVVMVILAIFMIYLVQGTVSKQERVVKIVTIDYEVGMRPVIKNIEKYHHSNDMNVLIYAIEHYIDNFENYEKSDNQYVAYIEKLKNLQKISSKGVIKVFQDRFTSQYSTKLGNNGFVKIKIDDIALNLQDFSLISKVKNLLIAQDIPSQATVTGTLYVFNGKKLEKKPISIEISFYFEKIRKEKDGKYKNIRFFVTEYSYSN